ncbi:alkylglycerol monooxygenase-like [Dysidea avara]|uniref:alkylglycerol monooxygenase-like n=1 Tax=Dysidea avara TaxID=196820 RepID=UPI00331BABFE
MFDLLTKMDNTSSMLLEKTLGPRVMFYLVFPSEATYQHVNDVPKYTQLAIPHFLAMMFIEAIILYAQNKKIPPVDDTINSMTHALLLFVFQILVLPIGVLSYSWVYRNYCVYELPWDSPWTWWIAAITVDCGYYWFHRMAHEINLFWASHQTHHSSEQYNLSTALRQSTVQQFTSWPFYLPLALFVPPSIFLIHRQLNLLYQFWIHTEVVSTLGPLEWILNTPSHHRVHHGRNPYCIDKNYAGMLIIWDRMFGTFQPEQDRVVYGLVHPNNYWNPLRGQYGGYWELLKRFCQTEGMRNKLCVLFMGPGWSPGKPRLGDGVPEVEYDPSQCYHKPTPRWLEVYCFIHFFLILYTMQVLSGRKNELLVAPLLLYCVLSLTNIGLLFDHHPFSPMGEVLRSSFVICLDLVTMGTTSTDLMGGVGVWILRGSMIMSSCIWLMLIIKLICSNNNNKEYKKL